MSFYFRRCKFESNVLGKCCYTLLLQKGMAIFRTCYPTNITSRNSPQIWWVIILLVAAITPNSFPGPSHFCIITTTNYDSTQICSRMFTETFLIEYMFHNYILLFVKYQNRYVIDSFLQKNSLSTWGQNGINVKRNSKIGTTWFDSTCWNCDHNVL